MDLNDIKKAVVSSQAGKSEEEKKKGVKNLIATIALTAAFLYYYEKVLKPSDEYLLPKSYFRYSFLHNYRWASLFGLTALLLFFGYPLIENFIIENNLINVKPDPASWMEWDYNDKLENPALPWWAQMTVYYVWFEFLYFISFRKILFIRLWSYNSKEKEATSSELRKKIRDKYKRKP